MSLLPDDPLVREWHIAGIVYARIVRIIHIRMWGQWHVTEYIAEGARVVPVNSRNSNSVRTLWAARDVHFEAVDAGLGLRPRRQRQGFGFGDNALVFAAVQIEVSIARQAGVQLPDCI